MVNRTLQGREFLRRKAANVGYIGNPLGEWSGRADGRGCKEPLSGRGQIPTFQGKAELTLLLPSCLGLVEIKLEITEDRFEGKHVGAVESIRP